MARLCEFPGLAPPERVWDWSPPPPVTDEGRQNVGNHKERLKAATMCVPRRMKAGGTSGNGKERLRDYSVSRVGSPKHSRKRNFRAGCAAAYD